jgi:uncharacterized protein
MAMKYVLFYATAPDGLSKAAENVAAHRARWSEFHERGDLLLVGPFTDAVNDGAMAVFTTRAAAEEFASGDPFVVNGVVGSWRISEWNEALGG